MHQQSSPPKRSAAAAAEPRPSITPPTEKKNDKTKKTKKLPLANQKSIASFFAFGAKPVPRPAPSLATATAPAPAIIPTTAKPAEKPTAVKSTAAKVDATKEALRDIVVGVCAPKSASMNKSSKPLPKDLPVPTNIGSPLRATKKARRATKKARIWETVLSQGVNDGDVDSNIHPEANVNLTINDDDVKAPVNAVDDGEEATVVLDTDDDADDNDDATVEITALDDDNDEEAVGVTAAIAELDVVFEPETMVEEEPIQKKTTKANAPKAAAILKKKNASSKFKPATIEAEQAKLFSAKHASITLKPTKKDLPPKPIKRDLAPENAKKEVTLNAAQKEVTKEPVVDNVSVVEMTEEAPTDDPTKAAEASPICPERAALMVKNEHMRQKYKLKSNELMQRGKAGLEEESFKVPKAQIPPLMESNDGSFPEGGVAMLAGLVQERYEVSGGGCWNRETIV